MPSYLLSQHTHIKGNDWEKTGRQVVAFAFVQNSKETPPTQRKKDRKLFRRHYSTQIQAYTIDIYCFPVSSRVSFKPQQASNHEGGRLKFGEKLLFSGLFDGRET